MVIIGWRSCLHWLCDDDTYADNNINNKKHLYGGMKFVVRGIGGVQID